MKNRNVINMQLAVITLKQGKSSVTLRCLTSDRKMLRKFFGPNKGPAKLFDTHLAWH